MAGAKGRNDGVLHIDGKVYYIKGSKVKDKYFASAYKWKTSPGARGNPTIGSDRWVAVSPEKYADLMMSRGVRPEPLVHPESPTTKGVSSRSQEGVTPPRPSRSDYTQMTDKELESRARVDAAKVARQEVITPATRVRDVTPGGGGERGSGVVDPLDRILDKLKNESGFIDFADTKNPLDPDDVLDAVMTTSRRTFADMDENVVSHFSDILEGRLRELESGIQSDMERSLFLTGSDLDESGIPTKHVGLTGQLEELNIASRSSSGGDLIRIKQEIKQVKKEIRTLAGKTTASSKDIKAYSAALIQMSPGGVDADQLADNTVMGRLSVMAESFSDDPEGLKAIKKAHEIEKKRRQAADIAEMNAFRWAAAEHSGIAHVSRGPLAGQVVRTAAQTSVRYSEDAMSGKRTIDAFGNLSGRQVTPLGILGDGDDLSDAIISIVRQKPMAMDSSLVPELAFMTSIDPTLAHMGMERGAGMLGHATSAAEFADLLDDVNVAKPTDELVGFVSRTVQSKIASIEIASDLSGLELSKAQDMARRLYLGTLYDTPLPSSSSSSLGTPLGHAPESIRKVKGELVTAPPDPSRLHRAQLKSVLGRKDDFSLAVSEYMQEMAPDLRAHLGRNDGRVGTLELQGLLEKSADKMRIPKSKYEFKSEFLNRLGEEKKVSAADRMLDKSMFSLDDAGESWHEFQDIESRLNVDPGERFGRAIGSEVFDAKMRHKLSRLQEMSPDSDMIPKLERGIANVQDLDSRDMLRMVWGASDDAMREGGASEGIIETLRLMEREFLPGIIESMPVSELEIADASGVIQHPMGKRLAGIRAGFNLESNAVRDFRNSRMPDYVLENLKPHLSGLRSQALGDTGLGNSLVGASKQEVVSMMSELGSSDAELIMSTSDFTGKYTIAGPMKGVGPEDDMYETVRMLLSPSGSREDQLSTIMKTGLSQEQASAQLRSGKTTMMLDFSFEQVSRILEPEMLTLTQMDEYRVGIEKLLRTLHPEVDPAVVRGWAEEETSKFLTYGDERYEQIRGRGYAPEFQAVPRKTGPVILSDAEAHISDALSKVGRPSLMSKERSSFGSALVEKTTGVLSGMGDEKAAKAFRDAPMFTMRGGVPEINPALLPTEMIPTGGSRVIRDTATGAGQSIVSEFFQEMKKRGHSAEEITELSRVMDPIRVGPGDMPRSQAAALFGADDSPVAMITPKHKIRGISAGTPVRTALDLPDLDGGPVRAPSSRTAEIVARAVLAREEEMEYARTPTTSGKRTVGEGSQKYVDQLVESADLQMQGLKDPKMRPWLNDEAIEVLERTSGSGRASGAVDGVAGAVDSATRSASKGSAVKQTAFNMDEAKKLWSSNKSMRYGAIGFAGLAAFGFYRNSQRKDRTQEDMNGPEGLPGGSAYENQAEPITIRNRKDFKPPMGGMTYRVNAMGEFDPQEMNSVMGQQTGGSSRLNVRQLHDPIGANQRKYDNIINGY